METIKLNISSDFGQIQIWDEEWESLEPPEWNEEAFENFACFDDKALFLGVIENDDHNISLTIHDHRPNPDLSSWDHIVEAPLHTPTGQLEIAEEPIEIPPGKYVVRWGIKVLDNGSGEYKLEMWPEQSTEINVLKKYVRST